jgi:glutamate-1-semialdehyde aminotransferase
MQLHFMTEPIQGPRDAARADARALRLMHLAMLARGIFAPTRQMYVLSTAMSGAEIDAFVTAFGDSLTAIAPALEPRAIPVGGR